MGGAFGDEMKDGDDAKEGKEGHGVATELEALRVFAESVGFKGDIMDRVVTQCAGGAIEEIHWDNKVYYYGQELPDLDGTLLLVGDLNMPKLRVLNLSGNGNLKGV
jgi:hypothetical protein